MCKNIQGIVKNTYESSWKFLYLIFFKAFLKTIVLK